jgi:hypothetical protein
VNWRDKVFSCIGIVIIAALAGCSTTGKSVGAGGLVGGGLGAGAGLLADPGDNGQNRIRNVFIGSAIGGALGAGTGYVADRFVKDEKDEAYKKGKSDKEKEISDRLDSSSVSQPRLLPAKTEARWIPDQIRGNTFIPGHFEFNIVEGARWESNK